MCAGIISACLPTLLPVATIIAAKLGILRILKLTPTATSPSGSRQLHASSGGRSDNLRTIGSGDMDLGDMRDRVESSRRSGGDPFYRLPDISKSDNIFVERLDERSESSNDGQSNNKTKTKTKA